MGAVPANVYRACSYVKKMLSVDVDFVIVRSCASRPAGPYNAAPRSFKYWELSDIELCPVPGMTCNEATPLAKCE